MDPTKNPVDPNRLRKISAPPTMGGSDIHRNPRGVRLSASLSGTHLPLIDPRTTRDEDIDDGELLLDDMVSEFTSPPGRLSPGTKLKFDLGLVNAEDSGPEARHYDERDFQSHRRESFAQTHQPLKPRHYRRKISAGSRMGSSTEFSDGLMVSQSEGQIIGTGGTGGQIDAIEEEEFPESWSLLLDPSSSTTSGVSRSRNIQIVKQNSVTNYEDFMESPAKKVQFEVGGSPYQSASEDVEVNVERKKHKTRTQKYEDPQWRLRQGSDLPLLLRGVDSSERPDLALPDNMPEHDKDGLSSHRFEDTKGFRRHKFYPKDQDGNNVGGFGQGVPKSNKYDHSPHEIFVELDMLSGQGDEREWQETARWIKYEEDLEEGADRWGKPHVASLSFHSLINLRRLLESGVVLMDLEERDLPGVAYRVVDQMGLNDLIRVEDKATVLRSLLLKHRHVHEGGRSVWGFGRRANTGSLTSLHTTNDDRHRNRPLTSAVSLEPTLTQRRNSSGAGTARMIRNDSMLGQAAAGGRNMQIQNGGHNNGEVHYGLRELNSSPAHIALDMTKMVGISQEDIRWLSNKEDILRRIPTGAEASIVLVGKDDSLENPTLAFARLATSVYMPNITEIPIPVRFVFILMGPSSCDLDYKEVGRSISTLMSNPQFHSIAYKADTRKDLLKGIHEFLDESIVLPPGDWDDQLFPFDELKQKSKDIRLRKQRRSVLKRAASGLDVIDTRKPSREETPPGDDPFRKTRQFFGGLKNDARRRYSVYMSDIRDGCNVQCLATIIFLYFACVSGAIAFGGLMGKKTDNYIGITETLIGSSIGGIIFALTSAQPLLIIGTTGPLLVFDESLFQFCQSLGMDGKEFLAVRTWIGLWMVVIGIFVALFEGAVIVRYFTRFTIEIFATYISLVFIVESLKSLMQIYVDHPLMVTYGLCTDGMMKEDIRRPNVALLGTILMFGTFAVANFFRGFRNSGYLNKSARKLLSNFAVLIAIVAMSGLDLLIKNTNMDKLDLPDAVKEGLKNSAEDRGWLINPFLNLDLYWIGASIFPALLLYILVFMETSIGELLIGKKELKLRKGSGFHLDVVVICSINALLGFLGTCWMSSAIIRGVTHTLALTVYSTNNPPGEKPTIVGVKEQRVTGLAVSILLGLSVLMADVLKLIPLTVLFGVFLFMGVSSMNGIQFLERVCLLFKQVQNHPQVPYVRRVRTWKMHIFTFIQVISLVFLWGVKESPAALALPIIIILLVPFRLSLMKYWFTPLELAALDAQGLEVEVPPEKPLTIAMLPFPGKVVKNGVFQVDENGKNGTTANGTLNDFRSI